MDNKEKPFENEEIGERLTFCEDGKYRWRYDLNLLKALSLHIVKTYRIHMNLSKNNSKLNKIHIDY
jgi:hypothetical protein